MTDNEQYLGVGVDEYHLCISLNRVVRATVAAALQAAPIHIQSLMGMLNLGGNLIPVLSAHRLLNLPDCPLHPSHCFVVLKHPIETDIYQSDDLIFALHVNKIMRLIDFKAFSLEKVQVLDEGNYRIFNLISDQGEKFWHFDTTDLLRGLDIRQLATLAESL